MHDRRVNGETLTFGNQGALFKNAMTWWDHGTESVWSQPWGRAIAGPLKDTALTLIPASIVPWATWLAEHPETTVVANDLDRGGSYVYEGTDRFVIGVELGEYATAYRYPLAAKRRVINDRIGEHPVAVFVDPDTRDIKVYLRRVATSDSIGDDPVEVEFRLDGDGATDVETGSTWDITRGVAVEGELKGSLLQQIPWVTSYDWAWADFFPHSTFYVD